METRNEIVCDLCTDMYASLKSENEKPTATMCCEIATQLVKVYPFMADSVSSEGGIAAVSQCTFCVCVCTCVCVCLLPSTVYCRLIPVFVW